MGISVSINWITKLTADAKIRQELLKISIPKINLRNKPVKQLPHFPGASELNNCNSKKRAVVSDTQTMS